MDVKHFFSISGTSVELLPVEVGIGSEHPMDGMEELPHDRDQRLDRLLALRDELFIVSLDARLVSSGDHCGQEQRGAQMADADDEESSETLEIFLAF